MQQSGGMYPSASSSPTPWMSASGHLMPPYGIPSASTTPPLTQREYSDYDLPMPQGFEQFSASTARPTPEVSPSLRTEFISLC